jgi:purine-nucleoside phosphorylase
MDLLRDELETACRLWQEKAWPRPDALVVSGSGLAVDLGTPVDGRFPLSELLPFPVASIEGQSLEGELVPFPGERWVLNLRGRLHLYQGYTPAQVVFPIRLAALLGTGVLLMSNASGSLQTRYSPGDLVLLHDQINATGLNPLRGSLPATWGPQFPDMVGAYDPRLRELARHKATELGIALRDGVYAGVLGPSYESPAEVRALRAVGADVVGMSTVLEVIAAHHMGLRCLVLSLVANHGAGMAVGGLTHGEVLAVARKAAPSIQRLLRALLEDPTTFETEA